MTLRAILVDAAAELDGVTVAPLDDGHTFLARDQVIAVVDGLGTAEFRLDPAVAAAARRTPDTVASERGADWVRFAPVVLDSQAADRAVAWLGSAVRRAGADPG